MNFTDQLRYIDDAKLDPYQKSLVIHYWRVGKCWETLRTTAEKCNMSLGKVKETRDWLLANNWAQWESVQVGKRSKMAIVLCSPHEQVQQLECSPHEHLSPHEQECSPHEQNDVVLVHDMNTILNEPKEELNEPKEEETKRGEPSVTPKRKRGKKEAELITWNLEPSIDTPQIRKLLADMEENRIKKRDPFTQNAANILAGKLNRVCEKEAVARLQTAVMSGWKTAFYPGDDHKYAHLSSNGHESAVLALKGKELKQVQGEF